MKYTLIATTLILAGCAPREGNVPADQPSSLQARREVWLAIQPLASAQKIDPGFVYALVKVESNFDPHARRGEARGLMQIKPRAWRNASSLPYETGAWEWRENLGVGIAGLGRLRRMLIEKGKFSYPLLWASYHYGYDFVAARSFDMSRIPRPSDPVSYRLWSGAVHPVPPPV